MEESFEYICQIPTQILTYGNSIDKFSNFREIAICITGNPGLPDFYQKFSIGLHAQLDKKIPVWVIGHLGHNEPPLETGKKVPQLKGNEDLFNLKTQVMHKIEFIKKFIPADVKIHLIGHSIGAWMILQMLRDEEIKKKIIKCYLLFPTVERMLESDNGWKFVNIVLPLYKFLGFIINIFSYIPPWLRIYLILAYTNLVSIPSYYVKVIDHLLKPTVLEKICFLAKDEMTYVRELDETIVKENQHLLQFYYGSTDGWVPVNYYTNMIQKFPQMQATLDSKGIEHAFVLRGSDKMASIVANMIKSNTKGGL